MKVPRMPQRAAPLGKHKAVTRTPSARSTRAEKKYERLTGRNPRLGKGGGGK